MSLSVDRGNSNCLPHSRHMAYCYRHLPEATQEYDFGKLEYPARTPLTGPGPVCGTTYKLSRCGKKNATHHHQQKNKNTAVCRLITENPCQLCVPLCFFHLCLYTVVAHMFVPSDFAQLFTEFLGKGHIGVGCSFFFSRDFALCGGRNAHLLRTCSVPPGSFSLHPFRWGV